MYTKSAVTSSYCGHLPAVSAITRATQCLRNKATKDGSMKVSLRISIACRNVRAGPNEVVRTRHVRDVARALDAEDEAFRRGVVPGGVILGALQRVEGAVELDRRQRVRRVLELAVLGQALGIKRSAAPRGIAPAGD